MAKVNKVMKYMDLRHRDEVIQKLDEMQTMTECVRMVKQLHDDGMLKHRSGDVFTVSISPRMRITFELQYVIHTDADHNGVVNWTLFRDGKPLDQHDMRSMILASELLGVPCESMRFTTLHSFLSIIMGTH